MNDLMIGLLAFIFFMGPIVGWAWLSSIPQIAKNLEPQKERERKENCLAQMKGLEKYHRMDVDRNQQDKKNVEAMSRLGKLSLQQSMNPPVQKDWAIWGGIASGIAGPAAGIMTASKVIQDNAKRKAGYADRIEAGRRENEFWQTMARSYERRRQRVLSIEELEEKYEIIRLRKPAELFSLIQFGDPKIEVDKTTGAIIVSVWWNQYDKSICIDGSLRAKIYTKSGKYAGCAYLVLPQNGTAESGGKLSGICACPIGTNAYLQFLWRQFWWRHYTVKIEPLDLWELALKQNRTT